MPPYFSASDSLYTLATNDHCKKYKDNLCFFRNVICARERAKNPKKIKAQKIKASDVKKLYVDLRVNMTDLPLDSRRFCGFDTPELNKACRYLNMNAYIFDCEVTDDGFKGSPGCD